MEETRTGFRQFEPEEEEPHKRDYIMDVKIQSRFTDIEDLKAQIKVLDGLKGAYDDMRLRVTFVDAAL